MSVTMATPISSQMRWRYDFLVKGKILVFHQYIINDGILHGHLEIWSFVSPRGHVISSIKKSYNHIQNYYNKLAPLCVFHVNSWMPNPILHPTINTLDACIHNFPELQYVKCGWGEGGRVGSESSAREACFKSVALY